MQIVNGRLSGRVNRIFWLTHGEQEPFSLLSLQKWKTEGGIARYSLASD